MSHKWTFLTNHGLILLIIYENHQITAGDIANTLGITERAVRKIIADLEAAKYITKTRIKYKINTLKYLRHQHFQGIMIGKLIQLLG
ncbi:MAG: helix-turn-helix domain-containing protein [Proteobacteria bacterium]|nr:helix-turn-helix domain-containing protein [Pseudomonadota bacterium]